MIEMYLAGISVRRVEDITEALWVRAEPSQTQPAAAVFIRKWVAPIRALIVHALPVSGFPRNSSLYAPLSDGAARFFALVGVGAPTSHMRQSIIL
jgi:hypothetical protein